MHTGKGKMYLTLPAPLCDIIAPRVLILRCKLLLNFFNSENLQSAKNICKTRTSAPLVKVKSNRGNLVAPASPIKYLLYQPNVRAVQYKLGPERLTRLGN